jgi:hypothetical protein
VDVNDITNDFLFVLQTVIDLGTIGPVFSLPSRSSRDLAPDDNTEEEGKHAWVCSAVS